MTKSKFHAYALTTAIALGIPTSSLAEISAADVWQSWKTYIESMGQTVTVGSKKQSSGALILNDIKMAFEMPEGTGSTSLKLLEFRERGDGTVAITMSPDMPFSMSVVPEDGDAVDLAMIFRQTGMTMVASGEPDNISIDYLASHMDLSVDTLVVDGVQFDLTTVVSLDGINGRLDVNRTDGISYSSRMTSESLSYEVAVFDPESGGHFNLNGDIANLQSNSNIVVPEDFDPEDSATLFNGDFAISGGLQSGATNSNLDFVDGSEGATVVSSSQSAELHFDLGDGSLEYGGSVEGVSYQLNSPQIPFPDVTVSFSELAFNFLMPLMKSSEPQDYGLLVRLAGLEVNDMIWSIFDGGQVMPRDPATVSLDVSGQMNWLLDITDPEQTAAFEDETPAELHGLKINEILVSALGAEISATGDFTFDNSDLTTFDGFPAPDGKIVADINGANGLMDRLVEMGFLPMDQAMAGRMMMGLFARPSGNGEDSMTSTIEIKGDGSIFANGQQLK